MAKESYRVAGTAQRYEYDPKFGREVPVGKPIGTRPITREKFERGLKQSARPTRRTTRGQAR